MQKRFVLLVLACWSVVAIWIAQLSASQHEQADSLEPVDCTNSIEGQCRGGVQRTHSRTTGITLATHVSVDRLSRLEALAIAYDGPVAAMVQVHSRQEELEALQMHKKLGVHRVMLKTWYRPCWMTEPVYPVNFLRNRVMEMVQTEWMLLIDADFFPSGNLHNVLHRVIYSQMALHPKRFAIAVPAMEAAADVGIPQGLNASRLQSFVQGGQMKPVLGEGAFDSVDGNYLIAHVEFINYARWYNTTKPYQVDYFSFANEPYLVVNIADNCTPAFDERFAFYGGDKCEWVHHLNATGVDFFVAPQDAFLIHAHHEKTSWALDERERTRHQIYEMIDMLIAEREGPRFKAALFHNGCWPDDRVE